ncbi:MAG: type II toxin-antitoxin system RelE/ParE family toxin [Solirubrobacterales bacterium]
MAEAEEELLALEQAAEIAAVLHAVEKLESQGTALRFPHQSAVRGTSASLRELRPRSGRSPVRVIYAQTGRRGFTVLAIGPDAKLNRRGFDSAVRRAKDRLAS